MGTSEHHLKMSVLRELRSAVIGESQSGGSATRMPAQSLKDELFHVQQTGGGQRSDGWSLS